MPLQRLLLLTAALLGSTIGIALLSYPYLYAQLTSEPDAASAFDFPLGAPDGEGYAVWVGFGIQNSYLPDQRTCFLDIDNSHVDQRFQATTPIPSMIISGGLNYSTSVLIGSAAMVPPKPQGME